MSDPTETARKAKGPLGPVTVPDTVMVTAAWPTTGPGRTVQRRNTERHRAATLDIDESPLLLDI
jgi:hypothetical protein